MREPSQPVDPKRSLRHIQILNGLGEETLNDLRRLCTWRTYRAGDQIISREARDRKLYLVASGKVRVAVYSAGGREVAFRDVSTGKSFGEISAIDGGPRSANVEAIEDSTIASLPPEMFWKLMEMHPCVMGNVLRVLTSTIRSLSDRLLELSTLGIQNRVHAELLRLAKAENLSNGKAVIEPAPRHVDIASRISANREQVTKELSAMARQGLVTKAGRALVIPDVSRLERLVSAVRQSA